MSDSDARSASHALSPFLFHRDTATSVGFGSNSLETSHPSIWDGLTKGHAGNLKLSFKYREPSSKVPYNAQLYTHFYVYETWQTSQGIVNQGGQCLVSTTSSGPIVACGYIAAIFYEALTRLTQLTHF
jgi:hypothetical protein